MSILERFVEKIRQEQGLTNEVPGFDSDNGNEVAKYLFVLEAPGRMAVKSGRLSPENNDPTARKFKEQLLKARIDKSEIVLWNIVPWYLGENGKIRSAKTSDVNVCFEYLDNLIARLKELECIVLVGSAARKAHVHLSHKTNLRVLSCHHPSPKVMNTSDEKDKENVEVFKAMKRLSETKRRQVLFAGLN